MQEIFNSQKPRLTIRLFLGIYLLFANFGARRLPYVKGAFFYMYKHFKNKKGIVSVTTNDGIKLYIDIADQIIATKLLQYGAWEDGLTALVKKIVRPGMTVVDVGAHVGYYSTLFSKLAGPKGRVFSFEPDPKNNAFLRANVSRNSISNCVTENMALSDKEGELTLYIDPANLGAHSVVDYGTSQGSVVITATTLDTYFHQAERVDFIKMDIEGWEEMALDGGYQSLSTNHAILMVLEFNPHALRQIGKEPKSLLQKLRSQGFYVFTIEHKTGGLKRRDHDESVLEFCGEGLANLLLSRDPGYPHFSGD